MDINTQIMSYNSGQLSGVQVTQMFLSVCCYVIMNEKYKSLNNHIWLYSSLTSSFSSLFPLHNWQYSNGGKKWHLLEANNKRLYTQPNEPNVENTFTL